MKAKYVNPFTDFGFKRIFGEEASKILSIDFLNALLPLSDKIVDLTFKNNRQTGQSAFESPLRGLSNRLLKPYIGGSSEKVQKNIGDFVTRKLIHFINNGDTYGAVNFPEVQLTAFTHSHRMWHVHENVPGILAQINIILAKYSANIQAQYLKTRENICYAITDIGSDYQSEMTQALRNIPQTIRFRILY